VIAAKVKTCVSRLDVSAEGLVRIGHGHMGVHLTVDHESVHAHDAGGRRRVLNEHILRGEVAIADGVDMVVAHGADAGQDHRILDLLLLTIPFEAGQQVSLILEAEYEDALELAGDA